MRKSFLSLVAVLAIATSASAQDQKFEEKVDVNLVLIDVNVTDRGGNQILGLTEDDFVVKENGVAQDLETVEYFTNRRLLTSPEQKAAFQVERVREERNFILFFHKPLDPGWAPGFRSELLQAKRSAERFIAERLQPQDRVAIAGFDARLKIYSDFTTDKAVLKRALNDMVKFGDGLKTGSGPILSEINSRKLIERTGTPYDALRVLADSVQPILGRKVLMLFSPGIGEPGMMDSLQDEQRYYRPMIEALHRANVTVYGAGMKAPFIAMENTVSRIATETGGEFFRNPVNYITPMREAEKDNSGYYLLSYYSQKPRDQHGFQRVEVDVKNREFRVKSREGYAY